MKRIILFSAIVLTATLMCSAQSGQVKATKPTIMVRPAVTWCFANGYVSEFDNQGTTVKTPNYQEALQSDQDLNAAIAKIEGQMSERGYRTTNFLQAINGVNNMAAANSVITSNTTGSSVAVSAMDEINMQAKADILFDVDWKVSVTGPRKTATYTPSAYEAYTYVSIASVSGSGQPSLLSEVPVLVEEAILGNMDRFLDTLQDFFNDCLENGRSIALYVNCFDNGSGVNMETEFNGKELREIIEDWVSDNSIGRSYNVVDDTETTLVFQNVKIALFDVRERPQSAYNFGNELRKYLNKELGLPTKQGGSRALGRYQLIIGEK